LWEARGIEKRERAEYFDEICIKLGIIVSRIRGIGRGNIELYAHIDGWQSFDTVLDLENTPPYPKKPQTSLTVGHNNAG